MPYIKIPSQHHCYRFCIGIAAGLILIGCQRSPERIRAERAGLTIVGEVEHNTEAGNGTVVRALGLDVFRFDYTLEKGKYEIDVWLEQWDRGSSEPERLTYGKGTSTDPIQGGSVVVGIMDPATTRSERRETWRVSISRIDKPGGSRAYKTILMPNPLHLPESYAQMSSMEGEVILATWATGETATIGNQQVNVETNARTIYLKMKVSPLKEE